MKVSVNWLQTYFEKPLPKPEELADVLTMHAFEVEAVERIGDDNVLDIDVLPNRAHDCLSHRGIARELSVLLGRRLARDPFSKPAVLTPAIDDVRISIEDTHACRRYAAALVTGVTVGTSLSWLTKLLGALGEHSVNAIVDAANYVMFDVGQPIHVYDLDAIKDVEIKNQKSKIKNISARFAKNGETLKALDGATYELTQGDIVIAGGERDEALGIAGIKGGTYSGITGGTANILIEAANFDPKRVRATRTRLKLATDASKRFENGLTPEAVPAGLAEAVALILKLCPNAQFEGYVDVYPEKHELRMVTTTASSVNKRIGGDMAEKDVSNILEQLRMVEGSVPPERLDINVEVDLIEEVARIHGFERVRPAELPPIPGAPELNRAWHAEHAIRDALVQEGFSEMYGYSFASAGDVHVSAPLSADKQYLRRNLVDGLTTYLASNVRNRDLVGVNEIRIFEIGTVFSADSEQRALGIAAEKEGSVRKAASSLEKKLGVTLGGNMKGNIYEANISRIIEDLPTPLTYGYERPDPAVTFAELSPYPHVTRDIALWVERGTSSDTVHEVILGAAGDDLAKARLFDSFKKDGRISYAFRLVFQSKEKTLTDDEVNRVMESVYESVRQKAWIVR